MPLSSRWLDSLESQFQALDAQYGGAGTEAAGVSIAPDPSTLGSTSGLSAVPQATGSSFMERLGAGAQQGGLAGALLSFAADPNADRSATGSNAFDALTGITRSLGRAIGSAYGNPGFALAARRADQDERYQNAMLEQTQAETDLALREQAEKRARSARIERALEGIDPTTKDGNAEAIRRLSDMGEHEIAGKVHGLYRADSETKPPQSRTRHVGDREVFEEFDPNTGTWGEVSSAPRWNPRGGDSVNVTVKSDDTLKTAMDTRNQYLKESGDFVTIRDARDAILSVNRDQTPAADMAMIFSYMKMLDPSSTVREGEYANAQNTAGWTERARGLYNQAASGRILTERQRKEFISATDRLYGPRLEQQKRRESDYKGTLNRFGLPADQIIPDTKRGVAPYFGDVTGTPDATAPVNVPPLPQNKGDLAVGAAYRMGDGSVAVWNGRSFDVVE